jgi:Skp family chaperone for outer membrane proteins
MLKLSRAAYSLIVLGFVGCGSSTMDSPADQLIKEVIKVESDYADGLEKKPPANLDEYKQRRRELAKRKHELYKKMDALNLSDDAKQQFRKKYEDESDKLETRVSEVESKYLRDEGKSKQAGKSR